MGQKLQENRRRITISSNLYTVGLVNDSVEASKYFPGLSVALSLRRLIKVRNSFVRNGMFFRGNFREPFKTEQRNM